MVLRLAYHFPKLLLAFDNLTLSFIYCIFVLWYQCTPIGPCKSALTPAELKLTNACTDRETLAVFSVIPNIE